MRTTLEETKDDLIDRAASLAASRKGAGAPPGEGAPQLLRTFYRHVAAEDITERSEVDLYGGAMSQYKLASHRPQGTANIRVFTPTVSEHGWSAGGHTVVEVVTDDMPFLVDSVTMELTEQARDVHMVVHPQLLVRRDMTGELLDILPDDEVGTSGHLPHDVFRESWMHIEIDRETEAADLEHIEQSLAKVLLDVREAVEDWEKMCRQAREIVSDLTTNPPPLPEQEIEEGKALLTWLADDHFTFLGYREYHLEGEGDDEVLRAVPGTGFGILRSDQDMSPSFGKLPPLVRAKAREKTLLVLAKANSKATVHRPVHLDYVGVKTFDANGEVAGERRFLGLFSSAAYTESLTRIPVIREKAKAVIDRAGFDPLSHTGKALMDVLENYPRDELFQTPVDELTAIAEAVLHTRERRQVRLFVRRDVYGRFLSCMVYLPRDRYTTAVRERIAAILKTQLGGESVEYTARVSESMLARLHFVVRPPKGELVGEYDVEDLERRLAEAARSWRDDFVSAVHAEYGEEEGAQLARAYADSFPEAFKEDYAPRTGAVDLGRLEAIEGDEGVALSLYQLPDSGPNEARLKVFRIGSPLSLSHVLPVLSSMGVEVVDERPYTLDDLARPSCIYDFGLRYHRPLPAAGRELFQDAVSAVWDDRNEVDGFNALVLAAGLTWRQATVLRAYAKYMRQGGTPFAQDYIEDALKQNVDITRLLVELFEARFNPGRNGDIASDAESRVAKTSELEDRIGKALDDVASLDHDRILRSYLTVIHATLRTNYFQPAPGGQPKPYISFKVRPDAIPDLPEPRPKFEIFVYSPRVEGVHLRFGAVARGGLRWSDRRDDFRTEVLGLVKAQMVKNAVIVPVGAKGGFFCKQLPDPGDREAWMAEGIACYKTFISGLLDVTDNLVGDATVPPEHVVRHDGDDAYLVVAADKGTATFSDIANGVAKDYGFWLGDAFASGGSVGYDHKAMGITARGAWESVRRHFRERGIDCQAEDFTCVGIGDMSGDVFGNGMLLSEHTRLVAAFDHRDIFLDPEPDAAASYAERRRLFDLPRSSWQDYDASLISEGGGVFPRSAKSIPVSAQVRRALGIAEDVSAMTPAELMRAILLADVDLLWNGGIGTYVKAASETDAEVGDKANDPIRVNGGELRAKCVGEGGNLGLTQKGRIEYAVAGGRINTDFIDNSAGVDTSDHEVNIKILLDQVVRNGDLTEKQRNDLLASMTDEVGTLVLADNYDQNIALASAARQAPALAARARGLDPPPRAQRPARPCARVAAEPQGRRGAARGPAGADRAGALGAAGLHQDRAGGRAAGHRPAGRPVPADRPVQLLPDPDAAHLPRPDGGPPAAPRDRGHAGGQRPGQRRRHHVLPPAVGGDRRLRRGAGAGQLRGARGVRLPGPARRDQRRRQQAAGRRADAHAAGDAHARRAGLPLADQQPPAPDGQRGRRRLLRRDRPAGGGGAAGAADRPRAAGVHRPPRRARRPGRARGARDPGGRPAAGVRRAQHRRDREARRGRRARGGACALRARRAARTVRAHRPDPVAAARGPVADDGPGGAARRPARRARPAHRAGARRDRGRRAGPGADLRVGGRRRGRRLPGGGNARRDLRGRPCRPGAPVRGAQGRAHDACHALRDSRP